MKKNEVNSMDFMDIRWKYFSWFISKICSSYPICLVLYCTLL